MELVRMLCFFVSVVFGVLVLESGSMLYGLFEIGVRVV